MDEFVDGVFRVDFLVELEYLEDSSDSQGGDGVALKSYFAGCASAAASSAEKPAPEASALADASARQADEDGGRVWREMGGKGGRRQGKGVKERGKR